MKQTLTERWVRTVANDFQGHAISWWYPASHWTVAAFAVVADGWFLRDIQRLNDFMVGFNLVGGFFWWERGGWLELNTAKDVELRQLRESRDELRRELDSLARDQRGDGRETRIRE